MNARRFGDRAALIEVLGTLAEAAGAVVRNAYDVGCLVESKGEDDVVTEADRAANALLVAALTERFPGVPVVAEESDPSSFAGFESAEAAFFVDPLDGTREFIARRDEFVVMIGLAEHGRATAGAIYAPMSGRTWLGAEGVGAFTRQGAQALQPIRVRDVSVPREMRLLVSRSRRVPALDDALTRAGVTQVGVRGSAGAKAVAVATGEVDAYAHLGRSGSLWDACAPEAIVRAAGGWCSDASGNAISYAQPDLALERGVLVASQASARELLRALRSM